MPIRFRELIRLIDTAEWEGWEDGNHGGLVIGLWNWKLDAGEQTLNR